MNHATAQLHQVAAATAQQIAWPQGGTLMGRCRIGKIPSGYEDLYLKVGRTGLWLARSDRRLYRKAVINGSSYYLLWDQETDRSQRKIARLTKAFLKLRLQHTAT